MTPDLLKSSKKLKFFKNFFLLETTQKVLIHVPNNIAGSFDEFQALILKKRTESFLKNFMTPDLQKSSKKLKFFKKFFLLETTQKVLLHVLNNIAGSFGEFQALILKIRTKSFLKNFMTPDLLKSSKKLKFFKNFFLLETTQKVLIHVANNIAGSFGEFQALILKKRTQSFLKNCMTPDLQKSSKKLKFFKKFFLLETTQKVLIHVQNNIAGSFGEFQALILKIRTKSFLKNFMTPDLLKSSKKLKFFKNFFLLETTQKVLIHVPNNIAGSFGEFQALILKKRTESFLKNFMTPDLQKSSKKLKFFKKFFLLETTQKVLLHVLNNIAGSFGEFQALILKIRTKSFLKNFMTPDMQKSSKKLKFFKKIFSTRNNLESLNTCSEQHYRQFR